MTAPLAIVQARMGSRRFPGKMLADLGGRPLVWWAWNAAVEAFGAANVVVAMPASAENDVLAEAVEGFGGTVFRWDGDEDDVLGRFVACARTYRWRDDTVVLRVTADDPFKVPDLMRRVADGERHPVELSCEGFTLAFLEVANRDYRPSMTTREHMTYLFTHRPPPAPPGVWTVDTPEDLEAAQRKVMVNRLAYAMAQPDGHP